MLVHRLPGSSRASRRRSNLSGSQSSRNHFPVGRPGSRRSHHHPAKKHENFAHQQRSRDGNACFSNKNRHSTRDGPAATGTVCQIYATTAAATTTTAAAASSTTAQRAADCTGMLDSIDDPRFGFIPLSAKKYISRNIASLN